MYEAEKTARRRSAQNNANVLKKPSDSPARKKRRKHPPLFKILRLAANLARRLVQRSFSAESRQMATDLDVPSRSAPASIILRAVSASLMPPEALTLTAALTEFRMRRTSSAVAPPVEKPVEVFTNFAPAASAARHAVIFSSSVKRHVSMMTFTAAPGTASTTVQISSSTAFIFPSLRSPTFITISISDAPPAAAVRASKAFASGLIAPSGKPTTQLRAHSAEREAHDAADGDGAAVEQRSRERDARRIYAHRREAVFARLRAELSYIVRRRGGIQISVVDISGKIHFTAAFPPSSVIRLFSTSSKIASASTELVFGCLCVSL